MAEYQIRRLDSNGDPQEVAYRYESDQIDQGNGVFGGPWDDSAQYLHEAVPQATLDTEADDTKWADLRNQRDTKLVSDADKARWAMIWAEHSGGSPWSQTNKDNWATYRQDLLDVPNDVTDITALDLSTYTWPTKPSMP